MAIVNSSDSDYAELIDAIRFRINNAYDSTDISDAKIENRACLGEGNKKIAGRIPGYASLDPETLG